MTDNRIKKIRVEIEKAYEEAQNRVKLVKDVYWEGRVDTYRNVLCVFDLMQEEPAPKVFEDMLNAKTAAESLGISPEEHDKIVDECLYGKEPELVDVDDLPNKKEESVSEDLEEAADDALNNVLNTHEIVNIRSCLEMFRLGAKWQKEQLIEKICMWLEDNISENCYGDNLEFTATSISNIDFLDQEALIRDLKEAMKDGQR